VATNSNCGISLLVTNSKPAFVGDESWNSRLDLTNKTIQGSLSGLVVLEISYTSEKYSNPLSPPF
jgi:hypothetical protein